MRGSSVTRCRSMALAADMAPAFDEDDDAGLEKKMIKKCVISSTRRCALEMTEDFPSSLTCLSASNKKKGETEGRRRIQKEKEGRGRGGTAVMGCDRLSPREKYQMHKKGSPLFFLSFFCSVSQGEIRL